MEGLNQEIERIIIRDTPEKDETIVVSSPQPWSSRLSALLVLDVSQLLTCLKSNQNQTGQKQGTKQNMQGGVGKRHAIKMVEG